MRGCHFEVEYTRILRLKDLPLSLVAQTDAICFAMSRDVSARMKRADYAGNLYGWGIGWLAAAYAHSHDMLVAVDESIEVRHPVGSGYPSRHARAQMIHFLRQFSTSEYVQFLVLSRHVEMMHRQQQAPAKEGADA